MKIKHLIKKLQKYEETLGKDIDVVIRYKEINGLDDLDHRLGLTETKYRNKIAIEIYIA